MQGKNGMLVIIVPILIIIILGVLVYAFNVGGIKNYIHENSNESISIKDLSQFPQNYTGQQIALSGTLQYMTTGIYSLQDNGGYYILIGNNVDGGGCIESQRNYNFNSQVYQVIGNWTAPGMEIVRNHPVGWRILTSYHLECNSPLT